LESPESLVCGLQTLGPAIVGYNIMKYCWNTKESNGYDSCDILLQHYNDDGFRTIALRKEDFERLKPWEFCDMLNRAYDNGRNAAMQDLRRFIGVKE